MAPVDFRQSLLKFASSVLPSVTAGYFNPPRHRTLWEFLVARQLWQISLVGHHKDESK
jgi:hypothetical protein